MGIQAAKSDQALQPILANVKEARALLMESMKAADALGEGIIRTHLGSTVNQLDDTKAILSERCTS